jgi:L-methionine (R)-S-oxide reductase
MNLSLKRKLYDSLVGQLAALLDGESDFLANAANTAAVLYHGLPEINWAGFYLLKEGQLVLGPFQGKPACVRIALGKGVCGTAAARRKAIVVPNVHEFSGHIACDCASNSEIVLPIVVGDRLIGVLDLDSPRLGRFDTEDQEGLERVVRVFLDVLGRRQKSDTETACSAIDNRDMSGLQSRYPSDPRAAS